MNPCSEEIEIHRRGVHPPVHLSLSQPEQQPWTSLPAFKELRIQEKKEDMEEPFVEDRESSWRQESSVEFFQSSGIWHFIDPAASPINVPFSVLVNSKEQSQLYSGDLLRGLKTLKSRKHLTNGVYLPQAWTHTGTCMDTHAHTYRHTYMYTNMHIPSSGEESAALTLLQGLLMDIDSKEGWAEACQSGFFCYSPALSMQGAQRTGVRFKVEDLTIAEVPWEAGEKCLHGPLSCLVKAGLRYVCSSDPQGPAVVHSLPTAQ